MVDLQSWLEYNAPRFVFDPPIVPKDSGLILVVIRGTSTRFDDAWTSWRTSFSGGASLTIQLYRVVSPECAVMAIETGPSAGQITLSDGLATATLEVV